MQKPSSMYCSFHKQIANSQRYDLGFEAILPPVPRRVVMSLTDGKQHGTGALTAPRPGATVAQDASLLWHQVVLKGLDKEIFALGVVPH